VRAGARLAFVPAFELSIKTPNFAVRNNPDPKPSGSASICAMFIGEADAKGFGIRDYCGGQRF
jgi:hypothetical protein